MQGAAVARPVEGLLSLRAPGDTLHGRSGSGLRLRTFWGESGTRSMLQAMNAPQRRWRVIAGARGCG